MKKDRDNNLLFGIIIGLAFIPIANNVVDIIINSMDIIRCKVNQKIIKENKITEDLQAEQEQEIDTQCIGFDLSPQEEYYEDDDEYFDD